MDPSQSTTRTQTLESVTGVHLMQAIGHKPAKGFWADAWSQVLKRPGAVLGIAWVSIITFFACFAPLIASGHPLVWRDMTGAEPVTTYPLFEYLTSVDLLLIFFGVAGPLWMLLPLPIARSKRLGILIAAGAQAALIALGAIYLQSRIRSGQAPALLLDAWMDTAEDSGLFGASGRRTLILIASLSISIIVSTAFLFIPFTRALLTRAAGVLCIGAVAFLCVSAKWTPKLESWPYHTREATGNFESVYTLVPWSPLQGDTAFNRKPPGSKPSEMIPEDRVYKTVEKPYILGTDANGRDVLSQMLHACRLSISIGFVSTSIAVVIGVTIGALMGYFGGWVDMVLYRVVEIFMSFPVLLLLIIAAGVLPRNTYVMMAIIGCFSWMTAARFIRAEFFKLRDQDFVQSARAVGLPLRSVLFKHMLPNGITPVLVDASFLIAAAINIEAIISYLGLGPGDRPSWGHLLSAATGQTGEFVWWLATFPGLAIFLTVLSYNLIGEALRDAIDPKLKKARV